jgi:antitoxin Phd
MREIRLRDAKATLSSLVDDAVAGKPSVITRHGKREAVVVGLEEWERLTQVPSFGRLLMSAPLSTADLRRRNRKPIRSR